jgi:hypothetical protein
MKMRSVVAACLLAASVTVQPLRGQDSKDLSLKGEVVDMHCYLTRAAKGADHAGCGNACLSRGVTAGFLAADGKLYFLLGENPFAVKDAVAGMAGETVVVKGTLVERDGVKGIQLKSVEKAAR